MSEVVDKVSSRAIETWGTQGFDVAATVFSQLTRSVEDFEHLHAANTLTKAEVPVLYEIGKRPDGDNDD